MLHSCWKIVILGLLLFLFCAAAPNTVLAQDEPTGSGVELSPERPQSAPMPAAQPPSEVSNPEANYYSSQPSDQQPPSQPFNQPYEQSSTQPASQPFQYPRYDYQNQQQGYGERYTRPGYYPSGSPDYAPPTNYSPYEQPQQPAPYYRGGVTCLPQGLVIPIDLRTSISTQVAKDGDFIEATVSNNVPLNGTGYLPAGTVVSGQITEAKAGRRLSRSGSLSIEFNSLRLPSGANFPISAHLIGSIGRYKDVNGIERGEGWKAKLGQFALRGVGGAGLGAALGTGLGAIVGGGSGAGTGAWAGAAFGGGLGAMDMLLRKGRDVIIPSGTEMKLQMEQPLNLPMSAG